jgi:hypothetical protein
MIQRYTPRQLTPLLICHVGPPYLHMALRYPNLLHLYMMRRSTESEDLPQSQGAETFPASLSVVISFTLTLESYLVNTPPCIPIVL